MAIDINKVRQTYATNREETLASAADLYGIDLSEWTFTEISAEEQKGDGNDVLIIFKSTLTKEDEDTIYITEIIDYHRLAYSYAYGQNTEEPEPAPYNPEDDDL